MDQKGIAPSSDGFQPNSVLVTSFLFLGMSSSKVLSFGVQKNLFSRTPPVQHPHEAPALVLQLPHLCCWQRVVPLATAAVACYIAILKWIEGGTFQSYHCLRPGFRKTCLNRCFPKSRNQMNIARSRTSSGAWKKRELSCMPATSSFPGPRGPTPQSRPIPLRWSKKEKNKQSSK